MNILIIGCGWLGQKVGRQLLDQNHQVLGTFRSEETRKKINDIGIEAVSIDRLSGLENLASIEIVLLFTPPNKQLPNDSYAKQLLSYAKLFGENTQFLFASSIGVYPKKEGVFEEDYLFLDSEKHTHLYMAEAQLSAFLSQRLLVFRLGGLIGEDRNPIYSLSGRTLPTNGQSSPFLVHSKDVFSALMQFCLKIKWGGTYNLFVNTQETKKEYYFRQAEQRGIEKPIFGMNYDIKRKIINDKIVRDLKFEFTELS